MDMCHCVECLRVDGFPSMGYGHGEVSFLYSRKKCLLLHMLKLFNPCVEFSEYRESSALCHGVRGGSRLASFCLFAYVFYIGLPRKKKVETKLLQM